MKPLVTVLLCLLYFPSFSQTYPTITGNLLRIELTKNEINFADTLGFWESFSLPGSYGETHYVKCFSFGSRSWLIYSRNYDYKYCCSHSGLDVINADSMNSYELTDWTNLDFFLPFMFFQTKMLSTETGFWLLNGSLGNTYIDKDFNFHTIKMSDDYTKNPVHLCGKIGNGYLAAYYKSYDDNEIVYKMIPDAEYPAMGSAGIEIKFYSPDYIQIESVQPIDQNLLLTLDGTGACIYVKKETGYLRTNACIPDVQRYKFNGTSLLTQTRERISRYQFNASDTSFSSGEVLFTFSPKQISENKISFDSEFEKIVILDSTQVNVYSIPDKMLIGSWNLIGIDSPSRPLINGNYLYLHQISKRNFVSVQNDTKVPDQFSVSVYPNPFNPSTTIKLNQKVKGSVSFSVTDILGRTVFNLSDQNLSPGFHEIPFSADFLSTGVYFLNVISGSEKQTIKLFLIK